MNNMDDPPSRSHLHLLSTPSSSSRSQIPMDNEGELLTGGGDAGLALFAQEIQTRSGKPNHKFVSHVVDIDQVVSQIRKAVGRVMNDALVLGHKIASGNNGTIVYQGTYQGRPAAVKRLVKGLHDDSIEIKSLIDSNNHPNVVRFYGMEKDDNFIYLVLELCDFTLSDLVNNKKYQELWSYSTISPSSDLLVLMRGIVAGLAHLHSLGFVHRNLKPSNVLMTGLCPKLSGMGSCRLLAEDEWMLEHDDIGWVARALLLRQHAVNLYSLGYQGWRAPELFLHGCETQAVDVFTLGCVLFFCLTKGEHPFGDRFERDANVINNIMRKFCLVQHIPEAMDLLPQLLNRNPESRPTASEVLRHPLFWTAEMRLSFLSDAGERLEMEHERDGIVLGALENKRRLVFLGESDGWMDHAFISQMTQCTKYNYDIVRDVLRIIQHTKNVYQELPTNIQNLLGAMPEGVDLYFRERFPTLLMEVYSVMYLHCKQEEWFRKYHPIRRLPIEFLYRSDQNNCRHRLSSFLDQGKNQIRGYFSPPSSACDQVASTSNQIYQISMAGERVISDALVLRQKISIGSNGTIVFGGTYRGRPAAVKRFVKSFHDFAEKEHRMLLASVHSNVIRLYGREEDDDFIYLALESYDCSLSELAEQKKLPVYLNGFPSPDLLMLIRGIVAGLAHLHSVGFVHPDLKPSDVLMVGLCPKLSGVGSCIHHAKDEASSGDDDSADGTSDAVVTSNSEIVLEQIPAMDMFSLGSVIYFCLELGAGLLSEPTEFCHEAKCLISKLLIYDLEVRPKASEVLVHPLFWNSERRLSFMKDASDWLEDKESDFLFRELEYRACLDFHNFGWHVKVRGDFLDEMKRTRKYNYKTVRGLLCIVRDAMNHYHTLPTNVQNLLGAMPEGVDLYFREQFPTLLMDVYNAMYLHCKQEEWFRKYMEIVYLYG